MGQHSNKAKTQGQAQRQDEVLGQNAPLLEITNLHKSLAGISVLKGINMTVQSGEIHALVGGNGAGKSTLIKSLSGYWIPDSGTIAVGGAPLDPSLKQIAFVQQDLGLIPSLTVSENVSLGVGFETGYLRNIRWKRQIEKVADLLAEIGHSEIDPRTEVRELDPVQRTAVAIARAAQRLRDGAKVLVLDEPTASLPVTEIGRLFETLDRLRDSGVGMIYVSHHLAEVFELSDRISVLRGGVLVSTEKVEATSEERTIELMLGRKLEDVQRRENDNDTEHLPPILQLNHLNSTKVFDVTMNVYPGEILGLTGLQGSGCTELAELIFGARKPGSGEILLEGEQVAFQHPSEGIKAGIGLVTEDRHLNGSFLDHSVSENISITDLRRFFNRGWLSRRKESDEVKQLINQFDIQPPDGQRRFSSLSGGNQQKAVLAKWLRLSPKLLICDQPDIGVDIGAKNAIYAALQKVAAEGSAVILISNQYDDLEALCNRVVVMRAGRVVAELVGDDVTEHAVSHAAIGSVNEETVMAK